MSVPKKPADTLKEAGRWSTEEHQRFMAGTIYLDDSDCYLWQRLEKSIINSRYQIWLTSALSCTKVLQQAPEIIKCQGLW